MVDISPFHHHVDLLIYVVVLWIIVTMCCSFPVPGRGGRSLKTLEYTDATEQILFTVLTMRSQGQKTRLRFQKTRAVFVKARCKPASPLLDGLLLVI